MKSLFSRFLYWRRIKLFKSKVLPGSILIDHFGKETIVDTVGSRGIIGSRPSHLLGLPVSGILTWGDIGELISDVKNPSDEITLDKMEVK